MNLYSHLWRVRSKGAILTLFVHSLASSAFLTLLWLFTELQYSKNGATHTLYVPGEVGLCIITISCPVAGWLADVYLTRHKVRRFGLLLMWVGMVSITATALLVTYCFDDCQHFQQIVYGTGSLAGVVLLSVGLSAYVVTSVQFGIDQMPEASSDELTAYIYWFIWMMFAGEVTASLTHFARHCVPFASIAYLMVPTTTLSLALCCDFLLRSCLIIEPGSPNSLKTIYQVLKFAVNHKYPIRRRAITYCDDEKPSRIDFAKDRYGGPYTTEQVEDVKTCFRITLVLVSTSALVIPGLLYILTLNYLLAIMTQEECGLKSLQIPNSVPVFAVVLLPLYVFVIYPIIKRRPLKMLQRVVVAAVVLVMLSSALFIVDSVEHAVNPDISCMFSATPNTDVLRPGLWMTIPSHFMLAVCILVYQIAIHEFTCAQSPYSMRSLLIGLMYTITFCAIAITSGILVAWKNLKRNVPPSCDFYYFLFQFLCAVFGLIVVSIVGKWYKRRRREEEDNQQNIVERVYDRLLQARSAVCEAGGDLHVDED